MYYCWLLGLYKRINRDVPKEKKGEEEETKRGVGEKSGPLNRSLIIYGPDLAHLSFLCIVCP
jgi:hypothetical protein